MKELKFRAWDKVEKKYIYLLGFIRDEKTNTIRIWFYQKGSIINQSFSISANLVEIEQYTEYGNIFENDFIDEGLVFWSEEYLGWFVKLFEYQYERKITPLYDCSENIIGNMHENPELLEKIK